MQLPKIIKKGKRIGRGHSKRGGKSGRGQKGQRSRAGSIRRSGFEGGQTPLYMRLPKQRGMKQRSVRLTQEMCDLSVHLLDRFENKTIVNLEMLRRAGLLPRDARRCKLVGGGKLSRSLTVRVDRASAGAKRAVEAAGGKVELIS